MKQKTGRKLLSFILMLAMVVGLVPGMSMTAYAAGDKTASTWNELQTTITNTSGDYEAPASEPTTIKLAGSMNADDNDDSTISFEAIPRYDIYVKTLTGTTYTINVMESETIREVTKHEKTIFSPDPRPAPEPRSLRLRG